MKMAYFYPLRLFLYGYIVDYKSYIIFFPLISHGAAIEAASGVIFGAIIYLYRLIYF